MDDPRASAEDSRFDELLEAWTFGEASEAQIEELGHLAKDDSSREQQLRLLRSLGSSATAMSDLSQADEDLIDQVLSTHCDRFTRKRLKKKIWIAATLTMIPLVAAAATVIGASSEPPDNVEESAAPMESTESSAPPKAVGPSVSAEQGQSAPANESGEESQSEDDEGKASPSALSKKSAAPSARDLLARAQNARSRGAYTEAISNYRRLLSSHPGSAEARLAHVSLAQLLLVQGSAAAALSEFQAYERSGGGSHSQEAHYGVIQALQALGWSSQEDAEIQRYLKRFPNSAQAAALKRRLGTQDDTP